ncbi:putative alpha-ketoglutarate dependent xanthine dioxygenase protein [Neofusicoccum parvum UCRNP2]|uniref:Putative alpha-ketoglutarate dependent xanthine dioxygenase protein n=1 Tax=Botryosphaeria parva (strain UCR-NP2) TaxID=1287680 RepID=R1E8L3_BOTPV|nr:putative alpha-ketoglutarate dependent xanthine dioxygenase protein [Neofusicoccum parvum UCRNP2]
MPAVLSAPSIQPLPKAPGSDVDFGAVITGLDVENMSDEDFAFVHDALYRNSVVVIKSSPQLLPKAQYELTRRFDPDVTTYGHGKTLDAKRSVLHPDLKTIPHQPQVQVIGNGFVREYEGLKDIQLRHPHHRKFHKTHVPDAEDLDCTRFFRWHIDAALYALNPPRVTSLLAVRVPRGRRQTCRYDDGSGDELDVPLGTTAFVSGYRMFALLSPADQELARTSRVEYAPHPYIWMSPAASRPTGLGMISEGKELPDAELPPVEQDKIMVLPMCWKNPVTGQLALQIHPSAVRKIHLKDGRVIEDLDEVRELVYRLQRPAIAPQYVYPHDWEEGDLVLFNNQGVIHSVVGAFAEDEVRLFRQCNLAASTRPAGPDDE